MKIDRTSVNERINSAIIVEDRSIPDDQTPERVRMQLDGMNVVIAVEALATSSNQLVASCDLPFLRLGSRLNLERAGRESTIQRGTLDWVALEVSDDAQMPRIRLGLGLDGVNATEDTLLTTPPQAANKQDLAPNEPSLALQQPSSTSPSRRWLGRLALIALGVMVAGVGSAVAGWRGDAPRPAAVATVLAVPLPPQIIVTPAPKSHRTHVAAATPQPPVAATNKNKTRRARRATARRARLKRIKTRRYLAWARTAMRRRRTKRARHLARLVLLLDPRNKSASAILAQR